jgi:type II secretory pathway component GspD/PulD (secretin)
MFSRNLIRQSLKNLAPALFLLLCCSIGASAQAPSEPQESTQAAKEVSFKDASLKATISDIGNQLNLNVVFDESMRDDKLSLDLKNVTVKQVMKIILIQKKLQARTIEENTIIVFPDNATNYHRYKQYELWSAKSDANK